MEGKSVNWSDYLSAATQFKEEIASGAAGLISAVQPDASSVAGSSRLKGQRHGFVSIADESRQDMQAKRSLFAQYREPDVPIWNGATWSNSASPRNTGHQSPLVKSPRQSLSRMSSIRSSCQSPTHRRLSQLSMSQSLALPPPLSMAPALAQRDLLLGLMGIHANAGWPEDMGARISPDRVLRAPPHSPPSRRRQAEALHELMRGGASRGGDLEDKAGDMDINKDKVQDIIDRGVLAHGLMQHESRSEAEHLARRGFFRHVVHLMQVPRLACAASELLSGVGRTHPGTLDRCLDLLVNVLPSVMGYPNEGPPAAFFTRTATRPCSAQFATSLRQGAVGVRLPTCTSPISTTAVGQGEHIKSTPVKAEGVIKGVGAHWRSSPGPHADHADAWPESCLLAAYVGDRQPQPVRAAAMGVLQAMACSSAGRAAIMATPKLLHLIGAFLEVEECHSELRVVAHVVRLLSKDSRTALLLGSNTHLMRQLCVAVTAALKACVVPGSGAGAGSGVGHQNISDDKYTQTKAKGVTRGKLRLARVLTGTLCELIKHRQSVSQMLVKWEEASQASPKPSPTHKTPSSSPVTKRPSTNTTKSPTSFHTVSPSHSISHHPAHSLHLARDMRVIRAAVSVLVKCAGHQHLAPAVWCALKLLSSLAALTNTNVTGLIRSTITDDGSVSAPPLMAVMGVLARDDVPMRARAAAMSILWLCINGEVRAPHHQLQLPSDPRVKDGPTPQPPTATERFINDLIKPQPGSTPFLQLCYAQLKIAATAPNNLTATCNNPSANPSQSKLVSKASVSASKVRSETSKGASDTLDMEDSTPDRPSDTESVHRSSTDAEDMSGGEEPREERVEEVHKEDGHPPPRVTLHGGLSLGPHTPHGGGVQGVVDSPPPFTFNFMNGGLEGEGGRGGADQTDDVEDADQDDDDGDDLRSLSHRMQVVHARQLTSATLSVLSICSTTKIAADLMIKPPPTTTTTSTSPLLPVLQQYVVPLMSPPQDCTTEDEGGVGTPGTHLQRQCLVLCSNLCLYPHTAVLAADAGLVAQAEYIVREVVVNARQIGCTSTGRHDKPGPVQHLLEPSHDTWLGQLVVPAGHVLANYWRHQPAEPEGKAAQAAELLCSALLRLLPVAPVVPVPLEGLVPRRPKGALLPPHLSVPRLQTVQSLCSALTQVIKSMAVATATGTTPATALPAGVSAATSAVSQMLVDITPVLVENAVLQLDDRSAMSTLLGALNSGMTCVWTLLATGSTPPAPVTKRLLPVLPLWLVGPRPTRAARSTGSDADAVDSNSGVLPVSVRAGAIGLVLLCVRVRAGAALVVQHTACMDALIEVYRVVQKGGGGEVNVGQLREVFQALKPLDKYKALRTVRVGVVSGVQDKEDTLIKDADESACVVSPLNAEEKGEGAQGVCAVVKAPVGVDGNAASGSANADDAGVDQDGHGSQQDV